MKFFALLSLFIGLTSQAAIRPYYQDVKFPTQRMVEHQTFTNLAAASTTAASSAAAGNTSAAAATLTTFSAQPDHARNVVITPNGVTADVAACTITVSGTDYLNDAITETFAFSANASTATTGAKAFKTITSVAFPANCEDSPFGATWAIGYGEKIGVKRCLDQPGHIFHSTLNGAKEATAPTMVAANATVSQNTADFNGTMNGANDFELFFMQNFRCTN